MYKERMTSYYPEVIRSIQEFKAIIDAQYPEFENLNVAIEDITKNAYLSTMGESRVQQWEHIFGIKPLEGSTVDDRRDTVIARIRGHGKLNSALINSIVNAFTGGTANSWVKNGTLYVEITPPPNNKQYQFANVRQELSNKVPAHLDLKISRNYFTWGDIYDNFTSWEEVNNTLGDWESVYLFVPFD